MPIAEVVDHLYVIREEEDLVFIYFLTNRSGYFIPIFVVFGFFVAAIWTAIHLGWNENVIAGMVGGAISLTWMTCYSMAEHITRFTITIDSDTVSLQRTFEGIPVGFKKKYARKLITDLGMYPVVVSRDQFSERLCSLRFWIGGRSLEVESYFPIAEAVSLANDLRKLGIEFEQTQERYDEDRLLYASTADYFTF
jgi:hypothetical protein